MPRRCAICCEKRRNLYLLCPNCTGEDKKCCTKCYSNLLKMCGSKSNCTSVHIYCAYCREKVPNETIDGATWFTSSHNYLLRCNALRTHKIEQVVLDRQEIINLVSENLSNLSIHMNEGNRFNENMRAMLRQREELQTQPLGDLWTEGGERITQPVACSSQATKTGEHRTKLSKRINFFDFFYNNFLAKYIKRE